MKTTAALVKLTVFMIVTSMLTFVLATTIGNLRFGGSREISAIFTDVTGLLPGNEVRVAGVIVGKVADIELTDDNLARVTLSVSDEHEIHSSTVARVRYRNLVGERYIALTPAPGEATPLEEGDTLPLTQTRPALDLTVLFNGFRPLFQGLDPQTINQLSFEIIRTLQGEGGTLESLLARTASLTTTLADRDAVIGRVIDNLTTVLATVDDRDAQLDALIRQLRRFAEGFAADRQAIGASLDGIADLTSSTAALLSDVRSPLRADIAELGQLARTLDANERQVDGVLQRLPRKLNTVTRTATYGSWFNFYLCRFDGRIVLPSGESVSPRFVNAAARCRR